MNENIFDKERPIQLINKRLTNMSSNLKKRFDRLNEKCHFYVPDEEVETERYFELSRILIWESTIFI